MTDITATAQGVLLTGGVINPTITFDGNQYVMLYGALPGSNHIQIDMATSPDGVTWTPVQPVITSANSPDWAVWREAPITLMYENGQYELWFFGNNRNLATDPGAGNGFGHATSSDGVNWTFDPTPIRFGFGDSGFEVEEVVRLGDTYHAYYIALSSTGFVTREAASSDGITFTDNPSFDIPANYTMLAATTTTINGTDCVFAILNDENGVNHYAISTDGSHFAVEGIVNLPANYGVNDIRIQNNTITFFGDTTANGVPAIGYSTAPMPDIAIGPTDAAHIFTAHGSAQAFLAELSNAAYYLDPSEHAGAGVNNIFPTATSAYNDASISLHLLTSSDLPSLTPTNLGADPNFPTVGLTDSGIYLNQNAAALMGTSIDALFVSFRGWNDFNTNFLGPIGDLLTQDTPDTRDLSNPLTYYDKLDQQVLGQSLFAALHDYIQVHSGITHVYVTGHSLGGATAQLFMEYLENHQADFPNVSFDAMTFESIGAFPRPQTTLISPIFLPRVVLRPMPERSPLFNRLSEAMSI